MAKRFHPDQKVKSLSIGGASIERAADGSFEIPPEHLAAVASHGFVDKLSMEQRAAEPQPIPAAALGHQADAAPLAQPKKRGRR